ncbi:hypothetical protein EDB89DRAFT_1841289 [Lactarius sanguifluus]|nr:hypothetical protein EDB89DRAFT_1841289 [Lactarius sanguifluus]
MSRTASSHSGSFSYPADSQQEPVSHNPGDDDEEEFVYPSPTHDPAPVDAAPLEAPEVSDIITSTTPPPAAESQESVPLEQRNVAESPSSSAALHQSSPRAPSDPSPSPSPSPPAQTHASPAQLEALYAAASSGDLPLLQGIIRNASETSNVEPFSLVNDASSRTGLTALHASASRGYLDIVKWLVESCGAIPDLEDKEGETSLHKAALHGRLRVVQFLVSSDADVHAQDADVNAASKGHLPVVLYLLTKQSANPLVRNNWGETAYDASAAVFEVWICEVLSKFEAEQWQHFSVPYDPLAVHTTVPLILYENQRLDTRLKTLAVSGGRPKFSASGLGKHGRRPPFELKLLKLDEETGKRLVPAWRSAVLLPLREEPFKLPKPGIKDVQSGVERSHFWLSDWTLDVTLPEVDAETGWQYAQSFDEPDDHWTPEPPARLERLLAGSSAVAALGASGSGSSSRLRSGPAPAHSWVRRRRWVRVMRRRLDIPPLPFLGPDGGYYHWLHDGTMLPFEDSTNNVGDSDGQELTTVPSNPLASAQDYVARARYLAGAQVRDSENVFQLNSAIEARRTIAKLERATMELRQGILGDNDSERKTQAEVLLNAYSRELERRRLAAGAQGLLLNTEDDDPIEEDDDDDGEFYYPGSSPPGTRRTSSVRSFSTEYFGQRPASRTPTDLTPHLSQAPEFRVPTHEAPQKVVAPKYPTPHELHARWERDHLVQNCRDCQRRFSFLLRRVCLYDFPSFE